MLTGSQYSKYRMGIKKIVKKLMSQPTEMRIDEVTILLDFLNYKLDRIHGSHYIFTKPGTKAIILPVHNNKIRKKIYLKKLRELL